MLSVVCALVLSQNPNNLIAETLGTDITTQLFNLKLKEAAALRSANPALVLKETEACEALVKPLLERKETKAVLEKGLKASNATTDYATMAANIVSDATTHKELMAALHALDDEEFSESHRKRLADGLKLVGDYIEESSPSTMSNSKSEAEKFLAEKMTPAMEKKLREIHDSVTSAQLAAGKRALRSSAMSKVSATKNLKSSDHALVASSEPQIFAYPWLFPYPYLAYPYTFYPFVWTVEAYMNTTAAVVDAVANATVPIMSPLFPFYWGYGLSPFWPFFP